MHYKVTQQFVGQIERDCESFNEASKAKTFIENKMRENISLKLKVTYRLYEWDDLLQEFDPSKMGFSDSSDSAQGQGKGASFRPSPLATAPRPPGMPPSSFKDDDEKKR